MGWKLLLNLTETNTKHKHFPMGKKGTCIHLFVILVIIRGLENKVYTYKIRILYKHQEMLFHVFTYYFNIIVLGSRDTEKWCSSPQLLVRRLKWFWDCQVVLTGNEYAHDTSILELIFVGFCSERNGKIFVWNYNTHLWVSKREL